uniref:Enoyl-CoA hydratase n=1 Tax=Graphocephala atropunctata TaxID=36148 RepID=A0A1B6MHD7_9HEMI
MNSCKQITKCSVCYGRFFSSSSTKCSEKTVITNRLNKVMTIGINRPDSCNALNYDTANRLSDAISQFEEDDSVSVAVIHGVAGNFCSGFDLKEMNNEPNLAEKLTALRLTDRFVSKPLVAAVSGYAVGVGMDLALWCDVRVMEDTAVLGYFQRRFGIPHSHGALDRLKHMVGLSRALDWVLTGRAIKAEEAYNCGLVGRLVACGTGLGQAYSVATSIAKFSPAALNTDRAALYLACLSEKHIQAGLVAAHREHHLQNAMKEAAEGVKKFAEGCGRHGKNTGLFDIETNMEISERQ